MTDESTDAANADLLDEVQLSIDQVAALIGKSKATIRRWERQGKLRAYRVGRDVRFRRADLAALFIPNDAA